MSSSYLCGNLKQHSRSADLQSHVLDICSTFSLPNSFNNLVHLVFNKRKKKRTINKFCHLFPLCWEMKMVDLPRILYKCWFYLAAGPWPWWGWQLLWSNGWKRLTDKKGLLPPEINRSSKMRHQNEILNLNEKEI